jgi:hypothetical protein
MGEMRSACKILIARREGKRSVGRNRKVRRKILN